MKQCVPIRYQLLYRTLTSIAFLRFPAQILPASSGVFYGREAETEHITSSLLADGPARVVILGPGGMGKTTLALTAMHDPRIKIKFQQRRFFIECDSAPSVESLKDIFAQKLSLDTQNPIDKLRKLFGLSPGPALLALDNFETPWEDPTTRVAVERFLSDLSDLEELSIIVTLRGAERPLGVSWTRPMLPALRPLNHVSAKEVFLSISDVDEDNQHVDKLIEVVDHVPLAITLIASQAQYISCEELLSRWETGKTAMVTRGFDGRLSSLDVSIQLSLSSPRLAAYPSAKDALRLLSLLPEPVSASFLGALSAPSVDIQLALSTLLRVSLVHEASGEFHILAPVREHVMQCLPIEDENLQVAFGHTSQLLDQYQRLIKDETSKLGEEYALQLSPFVVNMKAIVDHALSRPTAVHPHGSIRSALTLYKVYSKRRSAATFKSTFDVAYALLANPQYHDAKLEADCSFALAKFNEDPDKPGREFDHCIGLYESLGDWEGLFDAIASKAIAMDESATIVESLELNERASKIAGEHGDCIPSKDRAAFYAPYALQLWELGQIEEAMRVVRSVVELSESTAMAETRVVCYRLAAIIMRRRGLYRSALLYAEAAIALSTEIGADHSIAHSLLIAGCVLAVQSSTQEAIQRFHLSLQIFQHLERKAWSLTVMIYMAYTLMAAGRYDEAERYLDMWRAGSAGKGPEHSDPFCRLKIEFGDLVAARKLLDKSIIEHRRNGNVEVQRIIFYAGDLAMLERRPDVALNHFIVTCIGSCRRSNRLGLAMGLQRLGDSLWLGSEDRETARACYLVSLEIIKHLGCLRHQADCLLRLGLTEVHSPQSSILSDKRDASRTFERAKELYARSGDLTMMAYCDERIQALGKEAVRIANVTKVFISDLFPSS